MSREPEGYLVVVIVEDTSGVLSILTVDGEGALKVTTT